MELMGATIDEDEKTMCFKNGCAKFEKFNAAARAFSINRNHDELYWELLMVQKDLGSEPKEERTGTALKTAVSTKCDACGKIGHKEETCWQLHPEKRPKWFIARTKNGDRKSESQENKNNDE
jgi:hypothetical protein